MMSTVKTCRLGRSEPQVTLCIGVSIDMEHRIEEFLRYLVEMDHPGIEVSAAIIEGEPWNDGKSRNMAASGATTDVLIHTCVDNFSSVSLIERTRMELDADHDALVLAWKLDGLPDYRFMPNPFALGDWLAMRRDKFNAIGGYCESLKAGGWLENELIGRACASGSQVVMMDERVNHSWHASRYDSGYDANSQWNLQHIMQSGGSVGCVYYPDRHQLISANGVATVPVRRQIGSVVDTLRHEPHNEQYWECIFADKAVRLGQQAASSELKVTGPPGDHITNCMQAMS